MSKYVWQRLVGVMHGPNTPGSISQQVKSSLRPTVGNNGQIRVIRSLKSYVTYCLEVRRRWCTTRSSDPRILVETYLRVPQEQDPLSSIPLKCFQLGRRSIFQAKQVEVPSLKDVDGQEERMETSPHPAHSSLQGGVERRL